VALYAIFARLTRDEEMPRIEQLRHRALMLLIRARQLPAAIAACFRGRLAPRHRAVLFYPLAIVVATVGIVFAARSAGGTNCTPVNTVAASSGAAKNPAAAAAARSKLCKPAPTLYNFGH
jgi:hypothetical protein